MRLHNQQIELNRIANTEDYDDDDDALTDGETLLGIALDFDREIRNLYHLLRSSGFIPCDVPACNCGSWHQVGGFYARFEEIKEVVEPRNGQTLLDAVKELKSAFAQQRQ